MDSNVLFVLETYMTLSNKKKKKKNLISSSPPFSITGQMMFFKLVMPGMWNKVTFYTSAQACILSCLHQTLYYWEWMLNLKEEPFPFWECMLSCIWTPILTQLSIPLSTIFCVHCLFCVFVIQWLPLLWCIWTNKVLLSQATPNNCSWWGFFSLWK